MSKTRLQLFKSFNIIPDVPSVEKFTKKAYLEAEKKIYSGPERITTSFWASQFPANESSCDRQSVYHLMNLPDDGPFSENGRAITLMGQAAEDQIVYRWGKLGITVGGSVAVREGARTVQLYLEDKEIWLSGSVDAVLDLRPSYDSVLPVDVKSKSHEAIKEMKEGKRSYDEKHYAQVLAYIYLTSLVYEEMGWPEIGLKPPRGAVIFYVSRENPRYTHEYYIPAKWAEIEWAVGRLKMTRDSFLNGIILPREEGWMWSEGECKYCKFKKHACKPDQIKGINSVEKSSGIEWAKINKDYDLEYYKSKIISRWL